MLNAATRKLGKEGVLDSVHIEEADIAHSPFADETLDFSRLLGWPTFTCSLFKGSQGTSSGNEESRKDYCKLYKELL